MIPQQLSQHSPVPIADSSSRLFLNKPFPPHRLEHGSVSGFQVRAISCSPHSSHPPTATSSNPPVSRLGHAMRHKTRRCHPPLGNERHTEVIALPPIRPTAAVTGDSRSAPHQMSIWSRIIRNIIAVPPPDTAFHQHPQAVVNHCNFRRQQPRHHRRARRRSFHIFFEPLHPTSRVNRCSALSHTLAHRDGTSI